MTTSSSSISRYAWERTSAPGWISCPPTPSAVGQMSEKYSSVTFKAHTYALTTLGTSRTASRSPASPCATTSGASPNSATHCQASSTPTSSVRSSAGRTARPWSTNWGARSRVPCTSSRRLPPTTRPMRRRSGPSLTATSTRRKRNSVTATGPPRAARTGRTRRTADLPLPARSR